MLLAIETSSLVSSVALLHDDTLRAELTIQARLTHSEQLMPPYCRYAGQSFGC